MSKAYSYGRFGGVPLEPLAKRVVLLTAGSSMLLGSAACSRAHSEPKTTEVITSPDPNVVQIDAPERFAVSEVGTRQVFDELHVNGVVTLIGEHRVDESVRAVEPIGHSVLSAKCSGSGFDVFLTSEGLSRDGMFGTCRTLTLITAHKRFNTWN